MRRVWSTSTEGTQLAAAWQHIERGEALHAELAGLPVVIIEGKQTACSPLVERYRAPNLTFHVLRRLCPGEHRKVKPHAAALESAEALGGIDAVVRLLDSLRGQGWPRP